ncbi:MAG TPA: hypothetical protein VME46_08540 [Acidimicrobiales bacterium]|nr:hypothetical protein [Acidimicrobiales bacterium]
MNLGSCPLNPVACATDLIGSATGTVISAASNSIIGAWAADFQHAEQTMLTTLMGSWLTIPTPGITTTTPAIAFLAQNTAYLTGICGIVGLLIAACRMMWLQRAEPAKEALAGLLRLVIIQGAAVTAIGYLSAAADGLSNTILNNAANYYNGGMESVGQLSMNVIGSATLIIMLSGIAMIAFFVQLVLLIVRNGMLMLLAGTLPLSAAASMTPVGNSWFRRNVGWILAFLLFKPVAALVYAAAIVSATSSDDIIGEITGIVLVCLATLTLPALMRMVAPMVSAVGNVSTAAAVGMAATVATGAVAIVATGGAAAPVVAGALGHQGNSMGKQALGSGGSADGVADGSAQPAPAPGPPSSGAPSSGAPPPSMNSATAGSGPNGGAPSV